MPEMRDHVDLMSDRVAKSLTPGLQSAVRNAGWPSDLADGLSVGHTGGVLVPRFTGTGEQFKKVKDLEFGTYEAPPTGTVFSYFHANSTRKQIRDKSLRSMDEVLLKIQRLFS
jgi:hypothetical protein